MLESSPLIEARQLVKHYGQTEAVRGVSFAVKRGEVVGFLGPNGAGKSTTLKMLTGFLRPTAGEARIAGIDMAVAAKAAQAHIGYLPENAPLYDDMMVVDFLTFMAELRGVVGKRRRQRLRSVVDQCGLGDVLGKDIGALSKGFRQRVGLAQALLADPDLLILDEPTSGLDPNQLVDIRALITELGADKTVLLSTHILSEVQAVCSRAIIINDGRLIADATPGELGQGHSGQVHLSATFQAAKGRSLDQASLAAALARIDRMQTVRVTSEVAAAQGQGDVTFALEATSGDGDVRAEVFTAAVAQGVVMVQLSRVAQTLEETFQRLTGANKPARDRHAA